MSYQACHAARHNSHGLQTFVKYDMAATDTYSEATEKLIYRNGCERLKTRLNNCSLVYLDLSLVIRNESLACHHYQNRVPPNAGPHRPKEEIFIIHKTVHAIATMTMAILCTIHQLMGAARSKCRAYLASIILL